MATTIFGQLVVGPPGSGKSTYCKFICDNLKQLGRNAKIVNLDPGNEFLPYKPSIDLMQLVDTQTVMEKTNLGPNGAMIECIEILNKNFGWLYDQIVTLINTERERSEQLQKDEDTKSDLSKTRPYLIFDCPGQSEIYTHHRSMREIIKQLTTPNNHFDMRLVCLNLCDAYHASDLGKYIGLVMNSLSTMLNLGLPHLNILSKVDKIESYGTTRFNLDFYCEVMDLNYLLETELESPFHKKYHDLSKAIIGVVEDYSLVHFVPLNIKQAEDIFRVLQMADKANGYYCDDLDLSILQQNPQLMELASGRRSEPLDDSTIYPLNS